MSDIHCFYVSAGLLTAQHMKRIRASLPEFLWLVAHETKMQGKVLNGSPITISRIAEDLGESARTAKRNLNRLSREGYVTRKRNSSGEVYSYTIAHSKKWKIHWHETSYTPTGDKNGTGDKNVPGTGDKNVPTPGTKMAPGGDKNVPANKEDRYLDILDTSSTICTKCGGLGKFPELVPSTLDPDLKTRMWVKCDCRLDRD